MPPSRKRARASASADTTADASGSTIVLSGGAPEKPRTVDKYRSGAHTDVELQAADGSAFRAHALFLSLSLSLCGCVCLCLSVLRCGWSV